MPKVKLTAREIARLMNEGSPMACDMTAKLVTVKGEDTALIGIGAFVNPLTADLNIGNELFNVILPAGEATKFAEFLISLYPSEKPKRKRSTKKAQATTDESGQA